MSRNYYYLVSGLPELALDNDKSLPSEQLRQEILENVHPQDQSVVRAMYLSFDNRNIIRMIQNRKEEFDLRGNYTREELEVALKDPDAFPLYIQTFVEANRESRVIFPDASLEDTPNWLYYEEMTASDNDFVRDWFTFELDLRNVLTGLNLRKYSLQRSQSTRDGAWAGIIGKNDTTDAITRSSAPDFSLGSELPWIEKILSIGYDNLLERERRIDEVRWQKLDELTTFSYFSLEQVLAFVAKLTIADRWRALHAEAGKTKLDTLVGELAAGYQPSSESL